jgi:hypothetical protein
MIRPYHLLLLALPACTPAPDPKTTLGAPAPYATRSYLEVGPLLENAMKPVVFDLTQGNKRLVFIGCDHLEDSLHPQFARIGELFASERPQVAFNEGGSVRKDRRYASLAEAVAKDGETGVNKYWCDRTGIELLNGDMNDSTEFALMGAKYTRDELYLYYMMERFFGPKAMGAYEAGSYASLFPKYVNWVLPEKRFHLSAEERTYAHFKTCFEETVGKPFDMEKDVSVIEDFDYVNDSCRFCAVGRSTKMLRDSLLLTKIEEAFITYDRVLVTFGAGHALALEPALPQLMERVVEHP